MLNRQGGRRSMHTRVTAYLRELVLSMPARARDLCVHSFCCVRDGLWLTLTHGSHACRRRVGLKYFLAGPGTQPPIMRTNMCNMLARRLTARIDPKHKLLEVRTESAPARARPVGTVALQHIAGRMIPGSHKIAPRRRAHLRHSPHSSPDTPPAAPRPPTALYGSVR